jgi:Ca2+/Na+ antiporter
MKLLEDGAPDPADSSLKGLLILSRGTSIILFAVYLAYLFFQLRTHSTLFEAEGEDEQEDADMDVWSAGGWLVIITVITAFCADILVGSIDETAQQWHIPKRYVTLANRVLTSGSLVLSFFLSSVTLPNTSPPSGWLAKVGPVQIPIGVTANRCKER